MRNIARPQIETQGSNVRATRGVSGRDRLPRFFSIVPTFVSHSKLRKYRSPSLLSAGESLGMPDNLIPHSVTDPKNQPQVKETYLAGACPVFATDAVRISRLWNGGSHSFRPSMSPGKRFL